jgi:hypothetical protein
MVSTFHTVWTALEFAFSYRSKIHEICLKDDLQHLKWGSCSVTEYSRSFKALCDQLNAIGSPADETDKVHWFLHGLGSEFANFLTIQLSFLIFLPFEILSPRLKVLKIFKNHLKHLLSHLLLSLSPKATSIQHVMEAFVSFIVREEDLSFLVMARVVLIILDVARYVTTLNIRLLTTLIVM